MGTVLITGANRGIGLELVRCYASLGDTVVACCRAPEAAHELHEIAAAHTSVRVEQLKVTEPVSVAGLKSRLGEQTIDILLNNAGAPGPFLDKEPQGALDFEAWHDTFAVNTLAPLHVLRQLRSNLARDGGGKAITVSSQMGAISFEMPNTMYAYCASKAALNKVMHMAADDFRTDSIAVHLLHPGWVQTDMGGANADITAAQSAAGIVKVIAGLGLDDAPSFMTWNGEPHAW